MINKHAHMLCNICNTGATCCHTIKHLVDSLLLIACDVCAESLLAVHLHQGLLDCRESSHGVTVSSAQRLRNHMVHHLELDQLLCCDLQSFCGLQGFQVTSQQLWLHLTDSYKDTLANLQAASWMLGSAVIHGCSLIKWLFAVGICRHSADNCNI